MDRHAARAHGRQIRARLTALAATLAVLNAGAWLALVLAAHRYPVLFALGVTAFVLGLRHAVDPDHIAAIDSTTRKLMHSGQRPLGVGFFFSLGHSTIVIVLGLLVAAFGTALKAHIGALHNTGALIGTSVSAAFLFIIALANTGILLDILRNTDTAAEEPQLPGGFLTRILRPALTMVTQSRHMYAVGVLFGLGFDTATEVALLGISAASGASGMPVVYIMILPLLFAAGMSLVDTAEGIGVLGAYSWAYVRPSRKFIYNVNMTLFSMIVSLVIGGAEALVLLGVPLGGAFSFANVGYGVLCVFGASLGISALLTNARTRQVAASE